MNLDKYRETVRSLREHAYNQQYKVNRDKWYKVAKEMEELIKENERLKRESVADD